MNDTCTAWDCLEVILKCGENGPIIDSTNLICKDFRQLSNLFNAPGQEFLKCTANCVTAEVVQLVRHQNMKPCCASLAVWMKDPKRFECWAQCGFCTVYITNRFGFKAIFDKADPGVAESEIYNKFYHLG